MKVSNEKKGPAPGCLGFIGIILPSYMGIIVNDYFGSQKKQPGLYIMESI